MIAKSIRRIKNLRNCGIPALLCFSTLSVTVMLVMLFYSSNLKSIESGTKKSLFSLVKSVLPQQSVLLMNHKDKKLWDYVRIHHLTKPTTIPYNLTAGSGNYANSFSYMVFNMFNRKMNGTFIEAGAYDGEAASNSLYLEKMGWQGILVECNPIILPKLRAKNRKAWISNVCLSLSDRPETLNFSTPVDWPASAKLGRPMNDKEMKDIGIDWMKNKTWLEYQLPCFPLYSIIKAVGAFQEIDFLSLDVEGSEIAVLKHFPFEEITIKVMLVEVLSYSKVEKAEMRTLLATKGYELVGNLGQDHLYALRSHIKDMKITKEF